MASLDAFVATMVLCEAPYDATLAQPAPAGHGASTADTKKRGGDTAAMRMSSLAAAAKQAVNNCLSYQPHHRSVEALAATMAFCEAPFEGTLAPPVSAGQGASVSGPKTSGAEAKHGSSNPPQPRQDRQQKRRTADVLAISETALLE